MALHFQCADGNRLLFAAAWALVGVGPDAAKHKEAVPALAAALKDEDRDVRHAAATALSEIGSTAGTHKGTAAAMIAAMKDEYARVGRMATGGMGEFIPVPKEAAVALIASLRGK